MRFFRPHPRSRPAYPDNGTNPFEPADIPDFEDAPEWATCNPTSAPRAPVVSSPRCRRSPRR